MVAVVAGALLVASLVIVVLSDRADWQRTRDDIVRQAQRLAASIEDVERPNVLRIVGAALRFQDQAIVTVTPEAVRPSDLPAGVSQDDFDYERLARGETLSGSHGGLAFAAAAAGPAPVSDGLLVVVVSRRLGGSGGIGPAILLVGVVTLAVAAAIAASLGRRLTRPLREAEQATRRIAAGDLAARVPVNPSDGDELATLARSINSMAAGLERSRGLERQFLLSVSHDLRTPLTSIRGYAEALADGRVPDPPQAASVILAESRRLERLVADLLELAKLGARRYSLDVRRTDVGEVVGATVDGFAPAAEGAGVALGMGTPVRGEFEAAADPDRLAQVVANLVENALKFARTRIDVGVDHLGGAGRSVHPDALFRRGAAAVEQVGPPEDPTNPGSDRTDGQGFLEGSVQLWVDDDGPGIGDDDLAHVFEPFYQSSRAPSRQVGTGLGLAIVRQLVDDMGGSVRAERGTAGGTRMVVTLRPWQ